MNLNSHHFRFVAVLALVALALVAQFAYGADLVALATQHPDASLGLAGLGLFGQISEESQEMLRVELKKTIEANVGQHESVVRLRSDVLDLFQKFEKINHGSQGGGSLALRDDRQVNELLEKATLTMRDRSQNEVRVQLPEGALQLHAKALVNATGLNQPLVVADRLAGIVAAPQRHIFVRDLLPVRPTTQNMVEYAREVAFTNNAAIVYNSPNYENVTKPESQFTFDLKNAAVQTIAHFMRASRQILDDANSLLAYLDTRMTYGLMLAEQDEILNGDGSTGHFDGLMHQATAYAGSGATSTDSQIDTLRRAIAQLEALEFQASAIILNPADWMKLQLIKDTTGEYIFGGPGTQRAPNCWGVPVVVTNQIAATRFLVGDMVAAAAIYDRQAPMLMISEHDADNFTKNMVTVRVENRSTLCVYRPTALVRGNFN